MLSSNRLRKELDDLLTTRELARRFKVSTMTIYNWRRYQKLPVIIIDATNKHAVRFHQGDVNKWARATGLTDRRKSPK
jgi:hypothetical protein